MSVVLTGPHQGEMNYLLPAQADEQMVQETMIAIRQLGRISDLHYNVSRNRIEVTHAFTVKGNARIIALTQLDKEITQVIDHLRLRATAPAPLNVLFSS